MARIRVNTIKSRGLVSAYFEYNDANNRVMEVGATTSGPWRATITLDDGSTIRIFEVDIDQTDVQANIAGMQLDMIEDPDDGNELIPGFSYGISVH